MKDRERERERDLQRNLGNIMAQAAFYERQTKLLRKLEEKPRDSWIIYSM